ARRPPELAPIGDAEGGQEAAFLDVALDDHAVAVDDRRTAELPLRGWDEEEAGIEDAELLLPEEIPIGVVAVKPLRAEEGHDVLSIGGDGAVRVRGLRMALDLRHAGARRPFPENLAGALIEAVDLPAIVGVVLHWLDVAVESRLQDRVTGCPD